MKVLSVAVSHSFVGPLCGGAMVLLAATAPAQNLFVAGASGNIYECMPGGVQSMFASGLQFKDGAFRRFGRPWFAKSPSPSSVLRTPSPSGEKAAKRRSIKVPCASSCSNWSCESHRPLQMDTEKRRRRGRNSFPSLRLSVSVVHVSWCCPPAPINLPVRRPFRTNSLLPRFQTLAYLANFRCPSRARWMPTKNFASHRR